MKDLLQNLKTLSDYLAENGSAQWADDVRKAAKLIELVEPHLEMLALMDRLQRAHKQSLSHVSKIEPQFMPTPSDVSLDGYMLTIQSDIARSLAIPNSVLTTWTT